MPSGVLNQIDETINRLSHKEQLCLIEQIVHKLQEGLIKNSTWQEHTFKDQLVAMASDPEIQTELQKIEQEFTITEADRLEKK